MENKTNRNHKTDKIVPQYNHISFEWIPKDLSAWNNDLKLKKKIKFEIFLGCVNKNQQSNTDFTNNKRKTKHKRRKSSPSNKEIKRIKIVNNGQTGFHICDASDTENSSLDLLTDDSTSSLNEFHQVTTSLNPATPNRIVLTIKKTSNKKKSQSSKDDIFLRKKIVCNGVSLGR